MGIIASLKEIVVLSVKAAEDIGSSGSKFSDQLWQIGVLGVVVLLLGATAWLLRIKEREPQEGDGQRPGVGNRQRFPAGNRAGCAMLRR